MGRLAQGWKLEWRRGIGYARFTHDKRQFLVSTGETDPRAARDEAARIYARTIATGAPRHVVAVAAHVPLVDAIAEWIASLEGQLDVTTLATYETTYARGHWLPFYDSLDAMCSPAMRERYRSARLKAATASTVHRECTTQDRLLQWCHTMGYVTEVPPRLKWNSHIVGTRVGPQREKAQELTEAQVDAILAALPEWRERGPRALEQKPFPIRDRFVFAYETSLRPATLSELVWGDVGTGVLTVRREADKSRFGRDVPLSRLALQALARVKAGAEQRRLPVGPRDPIFGKHVFRKTLGHAARAAGLTTVCPYDLRHARATHLTDAGGPLTGVSFLLGHKQVTTTNIYIKGSARAAAEALELGTRASADLEPVSESRVIDGARTRDNRIHNPETGPTVTQSCGVPETHEASENAGKRRPCRSVPRIDSLLRRGFWLTSAAWFRRAA